MVKCSPSLVCNKFWPLCWWILLLIRVHTTLTIVDLLLPKYQRQIKRCFQCVTIAWHVRANGVVSTLIDDGKFWPIRLRHSCVSLKNYPIDAYCVFRMRTMLMYIKLISVVIIGALMTHWCVKCDPCSEDYEGEIEREFVLRSPRNLTVRCHCVCFKQIKDLLGAK